jgi:hypothetical protein
MIDGKSSIDVNDLKSNVSFKKLADIIARTIDDKKKYRTGNLWIQYIEMVSLLRTFIKAERCGNWSLHLTTVKKMLPFFAAAGHNQYLKSAHLYLQNMIKLPSTNITLHSLFESGNHVIRRSNRFWAGLSADLVIEQELMRSMKSAGIF